MNCRVVVDNKPHPTLFFCEDVEVAESGEMTFLGVASESTMAVLRDIEWPIGVAWSY